MSEPYVIDEMISAKAIAARIEALAQEIRQSFAGTEKLVVVGLLRGSFVFIADLVRELDMNVEVDFLEASSYGDSMESSRRIPDAISSSFGASRVAFTVLKMPPPRFIISI